MKTLLFFFSLVVIALADPQLTSWYKGSTGSYARIYTSKETQATGTSVTTWSRNAGVQSSPTYAGVHQVAYSATKVYIRTTGLATHIMGPWYLNVAKTTDFPNFPANTSKIYCIPRTPVIPTTKTTTPTGATGYYVNGVAMFDMTDTYSYSSATGQDVANGGDKIWIREAYFNEGVTFDPAFAHQAGSQYHYHAQPPGLRNQLDDNVTLNSDKTYSEKTSLPTKHSPILAWAADGLPVYGPYGYSLPLDPNSGIRRMLTGFRLRTITTRTSLSAWSNRVHGAVTFYSGPAVSSTYGLGYYLEDYEYLGDIAGQTQTSGTTLGTFDLNEYNVRWCATPEFPNGTWAYFCTIKADGTPVFPFAVGRQYFGTSIGSEMTSYPETVTIDWNGGPNLAETNKAVDTTSSNDVTVTWNVAEGGTYTVKASDTLNNDWAPISTPTATSNVLSVTETNPKTAHPKRFYRINRTSLASFDNKGFDYTDPNAVTKSFTFSGGLPPDTTPITGVKVGGVSGTVLTYIRTGNSAPYSATVSVSFVPTTLNFNQAYTAVLSVTGPPPQMTALTFTSTNTYTR
ncbi:MAG: YHYH protein [Gloeobacteraceae cyanobacterium ES-bin-144]|nr:YHYH protein [Verrucomicrobiales bacterium]